MKTRVIQDEPQPAGRKTPVDLASAQMQRAMNIAGKMGAWSAAHWKTAVFGWLACVVVLFGFGGQIIGLKQIDQNDAGVGQSHRADQILKKAFPERAPQTEFVLIEGKGQTVNSPAFRATVGDVIGSVKSNPAIKSLNSPYGSSNKTLISDDRHAAIVKWEMRGDADEAQKNVDAVSAATEKVAKRHPGFYVGHAGVSSNKALDKMFLDQLKLAGERSIPITIVVLLLVLGSLVAVGIPILLALSGVLATIGVVAFTSHLVPADSNVNAVILLIGLAVGVDYSLFYIKRWREERAVGKESSAALAAAAATSGRSVLISGFTVLIAMAGLFFAGDKTYLSFGIATMIVVAVAMLGSLTVLPALLSKLGPRVDKGRIPFVHRFRNVARVTVPLVGNGVDDRSNAALKTLRNDVLPATVGRIPDATFAVTGNTAQSVDQNSQLKKKAPIVFGFVLIFAFGLLLVAFRSIVIALKAILLNLLSVAAAYGVMIAIFQYGWGTSLFDFTSNGGIAYWLPIFLFVILFGLSMDYHVFILTRVREARDRGLPTAEAVEEGISATAGVVTSAALVMVGVFAVFALMPILDMKEMGIGLAVAVLIDATIIRAVLLPASMTLLGDANWYLPKWLEWLPRLEPPAAGREPEERIDAPPVPVP